jgi:hypothetical protein
MAFDVAHSSLCICVDAGFSRSQPEEDDAWSHTFSVNRNCKEGLLAYFHSKGFSVQFMTLYYVPCILLTMNDFRFFSPCRFS